ncbi:MAG: flavodoxin [Lentisphaerae bacterium GWF2_52_8]|nr:MAG: flavodoxin [Lentisphaerae bacterium GWF2_52_8]
MSSEAKKILIAYFSHSGNTREIAKQIQKLTGGDIFEIQVVKPYPNEYNAVVEQAKKEINSGYKPELKNKVEDIGKYDVIFIGSPNWWSTIAPPVTAFLSCYDFSGKTIVPFMTHGGGGFGHSINDIKKLCLKSSILDGHAFQGSDVKKAQDEVAKWVHETITIKPNKVK